MLGGYSKDILEYLFRIYYKAIIGTNNAFFIHHITKPIKYSAGINYSKREIDYQLNRAYITLVLLQCIGDVFCEARSRDVNSSEKTTKTTLASSSSSLAPCLFLWRGS